MDSNFRKRREDLGLTQKQIADHLDISVQTVRNWEQGRSYPRLTLTQIQRLCWVLDLDLDNVVFLFFG